MPENIVPQIVYDLLADNVGVLDLIPQTESRVQGGKQGQAAVKGHAFHVSCRNAFVHNL